MRRIESCPPTVNRRQLLVAAGALALSAVRGLERETTALGASPRQQYIDAALERAFGDTRPDWDPDRGYRHNRAVMVQVYDYYRSLYRLEPDRFLWAGLARMVGGTVLRTLDLLVEGQGYIPATPDPGLLTSSMVGLAKTIFTELAWQHEAVLTASDTVLNEIASYDAMASATNSYAELWGKIADPASPAEVVEGNLLLLMNEQYDFVQPAFGAVVAAQPELAVGFTLFAAAVHPYHRDFAQTVPGGDGALLADRWRWVAGPGGMWETWLAIPQSERRRLIDLDLESIARRDWGPLLAEPLAAAAE